MKYKFALIVVVLMMTACSDYQSDAKNFVAQLEEENKNNFRAVFIEWQSEEFVKVDFTNGTTLLNCLIRRVEYTNSAGVVYGNTATQIGYGYRKFKLLASTRPFYGLRCQTNAAVKPSAFDYIVLSKTE